MSESHREQKQKALWRSLSRAGIGRAYHRRSLSEIVPAESDIMQWVGNPFEDIANGRGWTFIGTTEAYDAAILTARALHIQGQGALVMSAHRLSTWVRSSHEELDRVMEAKGLFLTSFYETTHEPPMAGWVAAGVEDLLTERLDNNGSVFLQMERPLDGEGWWTERLARTLSSRNRSLTL